MNRDTNTTLPDAPILPLIDVMLAEKIACVPVRAQGEIIGMVTVTDIVRTVPKSTRLTRLAQPAHVPKARLTDLEGRNRRGVSSTSLLDTHFRCVADVMTEGVVTVRPGAKVELGVSLMRQHTVRHLPVVSGDGNLLGLLSDRDVLNCLPPSQPQLRQWKAGRRRGRRKTRTTPEAEPCPRGDGPTLRSWSSLPI